MKPIFATITAIILLASGSSAQTVKIAGGAVLVPNGSTTPDYYNFTNLGPVAVGTSKSDAIFHVHTSSAITIPSKPTLTGPDASHFEVLMSATSATPDIPAGFTIRFSPQTPGQKNATFTLNSSASPYTFDITGLGVDGLPDPAPNPEFIGGKIKYKGKVNNNSGQVSISISDGYINYGELPAGQALITYTYSADNILDPQDLFLAEYLVKKPVAPPKETPKGPKYKTGPGKMKAVLPSQNGHIIIQVRLLDSAVVESNYRWNTVHLPLDFVFN